MVTGPDCEGPSVGDNDQLHVPFTPSFDVTLTDPSEADKENGSPLSAKVPEFDAEGPSFRDTEDELTASEGGPDKKFTAKKPGSALALPGPGNVNAPKASLV